MKLKTVFILSSIFISTSAIADQSYNVTFNNTQNRQAKIVVVSKICMHSAGDSPIYVNAKSSNSTTIRDSNSIAGCTNGYKQVFWNVYYNNTNYYTQIGFEHKKHKGWVTQITGKNISATCDGIPCSNTGTPGVKAGGPINITIN
ncbi:hypothetical protein KS18_04055 [Photorhabdus luminescens]|nr:hypothetical protein KS18_04055 [Photorhabdus luminescens]